MFCSAVAFLSQQTYWPLSSPGEISSFGSHDDRPTLRYFEMKMFFYPAAEMFQVVGPSLSAGVLG